MIKKFQNCLVVMMTRAMKFIKRKNVQITAGGRHKENHCIFVKRSLYHQNSWSRLIDLNTSFCLI